MPGYLMDPGLFRALLLFAPVLAAVGLWMLAQPGPSGRAGVILAFLWNFLALTIVNMLALEFDWWSFPGLEGGFFAGVPLDLILGWAVLWGVAGPLLFRRLTHLAPLVFFLWIDLLLMPRGEPYIHLGPHWLVGEALAILLGLGPGLLLARWTYLRRFPARRAAIQFVLFSGIVFLILPLTWRDQFGWEWRVLAWPPWLLSLLVQSVFLLGLPGVAALQEFAVRGGGTPFPLDPPRRPVFSGPYAYIANPMQTAMLLCFAALFAWTLQPFFAVSMAILLVYCVGFASWSEGADLDRRFESVEWRSFRAGVRTWLPRLRPFIADTDEPAVLFYDDRCADCAALVNWLEGLGPVGLRFRSARKFPGPPPRRLTYRSTSPAATGEYVTVGARALAAALNHVHLGWAFAGWLLRLPGVAEPGNLIAAAVGAGPHDLKDTEHLDVQRQDD